MNVKVKPIIKWTGGKYKEFALFQEFIPSFDRYIEPFFGGGGVFFALQPNADVIINDKSTDLIQFYQQIADQDFKTELYHYADAWDQITEICQLTWLKCELAFTAFVSRQLEMAELKEVVSSSLAEYLSKYALLSGSKFVINEKLFFTFLLNSVLDKSSRIQRICSKEERIFNSAELQDHFNTGLKSGVYLFFRNLMNKAFSKEVVLSKAKAAANWYFVREFCYASMFRYNAKGEFNIPYGGIAYNNKNFRQKADLIFAAETQKLFNRAKIYNLDFEALLNNLTLTNSDFIFLDPPYDSEFSEYDQNSFTQVDQQRLANYLINCAAKWMVVIKETKFIRDIYTNPKVNIRTFGKKYTYNVRGRNDRSVTHLIITNY